MGNTLVLVRVKEPLGGQPPDSFHEELFLPFGTREAVLGRLLSCPGFQSTPEGFAYTGWGRELEFYLRDPRFIVTERAAPWDMLPVVEALKDLGPFTMLDSNDRCIDVAYGQRGVYLLTADLRSLGLVHLDLLGAASVSIAGRSARRLPSPQADRTKKMSPGPSANHNP